MRVRCIALIILFLSFGYSARTQSESKKLALVLSGGGAKGLAHIPLLKTLDSLNIRPDLIVGNSMGSIVGGLYAMGYSGKQIEDIARSTNWDALLSNKLSLDYLNNAERDEFQKYIAEFEIEGFSPKLPFGLIQGEELEMYLTRLSYPANGIKSFDSLPIPFRCIAVDIVNGNEVVFDSGDIALAMRSSMSIPTVFAPVEYNGTYLVDGGILNNFPVNLARDWGADVIIGSDVSGGMMAKEDVNSILMLLIQATTIASNVRNDEQQMACDILIDHLPNLSYATGDFASADAIIEEGKIAVESNKATLTQLIDEFSNRSVSNKIELYKYDDEPILFDKVEIIGADKDKKDLLQSRFNIEERNISLDEIEGNIRNANGTRLFTKIGYKIYNKNDERILQYKVKSSERSYLKGAIHYDTERGAGIVLNYTLRDLLGNNSRTLVTVDAAENPKLRLQQQAYFGKFSKWWYRLEYFTERIVQNNYMSGSKLDQFTFNYSNSFLSLRRDIGSNSFIHFDGVIDVDRYKPQVSPNTKGIERDSLVLDFEKFRHVSYGIAFGYSANTLNQRYFSTKGSKQSLKALWFIQNDLVANFYSDLLGIVDFSFKNLWRFEYSVEKNFTVNSKLVIKPELNIRHLYATRESDYTLSALKYQFIGGIEPRPGTQFLNFNGLRNGELPAAQAQILSVKAQWSLKPNIFFTPQVSAGIIGSESLENYFDNYFNAKPNWFEFNQASYIYTYGLNIGYLSAIGPIQFNAARVSELNKLSEIRLYLSFGYQFF